MCLLISGTALSRPLASLLAQFEHSGVSILISGTVHLPLPPAHFLAHASFPARKLRRVFLRLLPLVDRVRVAG